MRNSVEADGVIRMGPADGPPVLLLHSWWGLTVAVDEWATSLAEAGHRVLVPDFFGGQTADTEEDAQWLLATVDRDERRALAERCADELAGLDRRWAAVGFSLGAMYACHLASRGTAGPDELFLFYGGGDPAGDVSRTRRAQLHFVRDDDFFSDEEITAAEEALGAAGIDLQTFEYPGSKHWFAEPGSPGFDEGAFVLAKSRVLEQLCTPLN